MHTLCIRGVHIYIYICIYIYTYTIPAQDSLSAGGPRALDAPLASARDFGVAPCTDDNDTNNVCTYVTCIHTYIYIYIHIYTHVRIYTCVSLLRSSSFLVGVKIDMDCVHRHVSGDYGQSPYKDSGFQRVWLKHHICFKAWNSQAHWEFHGNVEPRNLSRG